MAMVIGNGSLRLSLATVIGNCHRALRIAYCSTIARRTRISFGPHVRFANRGEINSLIAGDFKLAGAQMAASYNKVALI